MLEREARLLQSSNKQRNRDKQAEYMFSLKRQLPTLGFNTADFLLKPLLFSNSPPLKNVCFVFLSFIVFDQLVYCLLLLPDCNSRSPRLYLFLFIQKQILNAYCQALHIHTIWHLASRCILFGGRNRPHRSISNICQHVIFFCSKLSF